MTERRVPIGTRVLGWAGRHVDAETLDTIVEPAIADLQYEAKQTARRYALVRWAMRVRGYVGLAEALGVHLVSRHAAASNVREVAGSRAAGPGLARSPIMTESTRNPLLMIGAGVLVASAAFVAGRVSAPLPPRSSVEAPVAAPAALDAYRALQRSVDEQNREAAERDRKLQAELDWQRYNADIRSAQAERARIDAETELASQQTQQLIEQRRQAAELETAKLESARRDAYLELARQRTQLMLEELGRKR